jgi:hypothetical protein
LRRKGVPLQAIFHWSFSYVTSLENYIQVEKMLREIQMSEKS